MEDINTDAVNAVARSLYGETEYDALPEGQVKTAYRKRARLIIGTECAREEPRQIVNFHLTAE